VLAVFFDWIDQQFQCQGLLPSNPFTETLAYARERRAGLEVFITDPEVPVDTNRLERALRVIPTDRKN
jgi:transposase